MHWGNGKNLSLYFSGLICKNIDPAFWCLHTSTMQGLQHAWHSASHKTRAQCVSSFFLSSSNASPGYFCLLPFYCSTNPDNLQVLSKHPWGQRLVSFASILRILTYTGGSSVSLYRIQYLMLPLPAGLPCRGDSPHVPWSRLYWNTWNVARTVQKLFLVHVLIICACINLNLIYLTSIYWKETFSDSIARAQMQSPASSDGQIFFSHFPIFLFNSSDFLPSQTQFLYASTILWWCRLWCRLMVATQMFLQRI